jgi:outer membrane protein assembly factor BamB
VSANGIQDGIVWALRTKGWDSSDRPAELYAFEASHISRLLYDSETNASRDRAGIARRFVVPVVAMGRVYVGTSDGVDVYGLLPTKAKPSKP